MWNYLLFHYYLGMHLVCEVVSQFILCHLCMSPCTLLGDTCHVLVLLYRLESLLFVLVFASFNKASLLNIVSEVGF